MSKRVSHSVLDPWVTTPLRAVYGWLPIPAAFPPEGIVVIGHLCAIAAAFGFAFSTRFWWGGLLAAVGVAGNHLADVLDGTHARATGQCRNGGELLDHFLDPLSFAYLAVGLGVSCGRLELGLAGVICLYATSVLTNIKAKMIGEFTLASFGPTEFKTLLVVYGLLIGFWTQGLIPWGGPRAAAAWFLSSMVVVGVVQLVVNLSRAMAEVNQRGKPPDTTEWETSRAS